MSALFSEKRHFFTSGHFGGSYSAKYFGGLGLRTLNPTIIAEIADFGTKIMTNA
jgi:hypothetical protein